MMIPLAKSQIEYGRHYSGKCGTHNVSHDPQDVLNNLFLE